MREILILAFTLMVIALPAAGELSEYQKGFIKGLEAGYFMGDLKGRAYYSTEAAKQFDSYLEQYNRLISYVLWNNETLLKTYLLYPVAFRNPVTPFGPLPDAEGRIGEYPAEAFYTATGSGPKVSANNPGRDAMGWV